MGKIMYVEIVLIASLLDHIRFDIKAFVENLNGLSFAKGFHQHSTLPSS